MEHKYTFLGTIFCKWLKWHWREPYHWHYEGRVNAVCKLCGVVVSRPTQRAADASPAGFEDEEFDALLDSDIDGK